MAQTILQWNSRSISNKKSDLIHLINKFNLSILSISELWLKPSHNFRIPGFALIRDVRSDGFGGCALFIKNSLLFSSINIPPPNDFNIVAARVDNCTFVSVYIPHPSKLILSQLSSILQSLPSPLLILGDLNCHSRVWGCGKSDSRGNDLLEMLDSLNLCILNSGSPTRRSRPSELPSAVDISLCSPNLAPLLSWETLNSSFGSDHFPILLTSLRSPNSLYSRSPNLPLLKFSLLNADWDEYKLELNNFSSSLPPISAEHIDECAEAFSRGIIQCAELVFPFKKIVSDRIPSPPWWDPECTAAIKHRKQCEIEYRHNICQGNFIQLSKCIAETKLLLQSKKREGWVSFCSSISPSTPASFLWGNIRKFRGCKQLSSRAHPPSREWADSFMDLLAPPYTPSFAESNPSYCLNSLDSLDEPFSLVELKIVLSKVKDSTPGHDGIPYSFLCNSCDSFLSYYLELANVIFVSGSIPRLWKSQLIIPILKPNKDPADPTSYRPIALSSVLLKTMEHLIKNRLEWFVESNNLLPSHQFGFRKGRSTIDSLGIFTSDIRIAFSSGKSVVAAFLDVKAAYDNVQLPILLDKLRQINSPMRLSNLIIRILSDRSITLRGNDRDIVPTRSIWKGLPQGSVLSPLLFNIYTADLYSAREQSSILQYADDVLIYSSNSSISNAAECIKRSLKSINNWLSHHGFDLSPSKSNIVIFSRKKTLPPVNISLSGHNIPVKPHFKFLGLVLDSKLLGLAHCEYIEAKCERNLNILRSLAGVWWGAHPFALKLLYNAIVRSVLDYGTFLLEPANQAALRNLDRIQSKALRIISGAMRSSPLNALRVECLEPPLDLRRQFLSDRYLFRTFQFSVHPIFPKIADLNLLFRSSPFWVNKPPPCLITSFRRFQLIKDPTYHSPNLPMFEFPYHVTILQPRIILDFNILKGDVCARERVQGTLGEDWSKWHTLYSDASKLSPVGCVGVGTFHSQYGIVQKVKCPPESSVFSGECVGILKCLEYVLVARLKRSIVFSDSRSALESLISNPFSSKIHNPLVFMIKNKINDCYLRGYEIILAWIPSHSGIPGNEAADRLAKEAVRSGDKVPFFKNCCFDLLSLPKNYLFKCWNTRWHISSRNKGAKLAALQPDVGRKVWFSKIVLSKKATSSIIRMRLGHCHSPVHLARLRIRDSSLCECGLDEGSLNHLFLSCPLLNHTNLYAGLIFQKVPFPTHMPSLLDPNPAIFRLLSNFLSINKLKL